MKVLTRTALALVLMASSAGLAHAQDRGERADRDGRWGEGRGEAEPGARSEARPPQPQREAPTMGGWQRDANGGTWRGVPQGRVETPQPSPPAVVVRRENHDGDRFEGRWGGDRDGGRAWGGDRDDHRGWRGDDRNGRRGWDWDDRRDWSWRDRDRDRDDWRWRSPNRYRGWDYRPPAGFYSHSWIFGDLLPRSWWTPDYYIVQWWSYGLPRPPAGYQWIRVNDDALLIDRFTGRVSRVVYDVFW